VTRWARLLVFSVGAVGVAAMFAAAFFKMPAFGGMVHLYRDLAVPAAVAHHTANVVSSVNFDQRGFDTLGEETILLASVIGAAVLLRPSAEEAEMRPQRSGRTLEATKLAGYLLLPVTLLIGFDVVLHGQVTPGGGFQGGVVLATGLHLTYVAGNYPALDRLRPLEVFDVGEALGAFAFGALGVAGIAVTGVFLANILPQGTFGQLMSGGTVLALNWAVGLEVGCGAVVLLAHFLQQDIIVAAKTQQAVRTGITGPRAMEGAGASERLSLLRRRLADGDRRLRHRPQPEHGAPSGVAIGGPGRHLRAAAGGRLPAGRPRARLRLHDEADQARRRPRGTGHDADRHRGLRHRDRPAAHAGGAGQQAAGHGRPGRAHGTEGLTWLPGS
jgi:multicomponent Na+:H+ antiporter subunit B